MYGFCMKYLITEKINADFAAFGDFSHIKTDKEKVFEIYGMPENTESFDMTQYSFNPYGFNDFNTSAVFVSTDDFADIYHEDSNIKKIINNLVVLPSGKVMEITNVEYMTPGVNNLFSYNDVKSVYKLTIRPYEFKSTDEITDNVLQHDSKFKTANEYDDTVKDLDDTLSALASLNGSFESAEVKSEEQTKYDALDDYFERLAAKKSQQDNETEINAYTPKVKHTGDVEETVDVPVYDKSNPDPWNGF